MEDVGWWDPNPGVCVFCWYWLTAGAQPTPKVTQLLGRIGLFTEVPRPPSYRVGTPTMPKWQAGADKE